jgi:hypothetical protein
MFWFPKNHYQAINNTTKITEITNIYGDWKQNIWCRLDHQIYSIKKK